MHLRSKGTIQKSQKREPTAAGDAVQRLSGQSLRGSPSPENTTVAHGKRRMIRGVDDRPPISTREPPMRRRKKVDGRSHRRRVPTARGLWVQATHGDVVEALVEASPETVRRGNDGWHDPPPPRRLH